MPTKCFIWFKQRNFVPTKICVFTVLKSELLPVDARHFPTNGFTFQDDNAPAQRGRIVTEFKQRNANGNIKKIKGGNFLIFYQNQVSYDAHKFSISTFIYVCVTLSTFVHRLMAQYCLCFYYVISKQMNILSL